MKYHVTLEVSADLIFAMDIVDGNEVSAARSAWDVFQSQFLNLDLGRTVVSDVQLSGASVSDDEYDNWWDIDGETIEEG